MKTEWKKKKENIIDMCRLSQQRGWVIRAPLFIHYLIAVFGTFRINFKNTQNDTEFP